MITFDQLLANEWTHGFHTDVVPKKFKMWHKYSEHPRKVFVSRDTMEKSLKIEEEEFSLFIDEPTGGMFTIKAFDKVDEYKNNINIRFLYAPDDSTWARGMQAFYDVKNDFFVCISEDWKEYE